MFQGKENILKSKATWIGGELKLLIYSERHPYGNIYACNYELLNVVNVWSALNKTGCVLMHNLPKWYKAV